MKQRPKFKLVKSLLKFLAIPAFFGTVIASVAYGLPSSVNNNALASNQNRLVPQVDSTTPISQPTIDDVVNGDVSSLSQPILTAAGSYILPTLTSTKIPGFIKTNSFVSATYGINFSDFTGYHVRQIVQNYNDQNQYFVLLVNDNASATVSFNTTSASNTGWSYSFRITNPGHVLAVSDTGSGFIVTADYQLDKPVLDQSMLNYYKNMFFQPPLKPTQKQNYWTPVDTPYGSDGNTPPNYNVTDPWINLTPRSLNISTRTIRENKLPSYTIGVGTSLKKMDQTWTGYTKNVATILYLNSLNNMVFVSNKFNNSGSDAIYLFGGNKAINLWFYAFDVNQTNDPTTPISETATAYANYRIYFPQVGIATSTVDSSDIDTQKAYNFNLVTNDLSNQGASLQSNPYPDASFFGYYVAGAKFISKPNPQIELALTIPNFSLFQNNEVVVFTTNVMVDSGDKYSQAPQSRILNLYGSISIDNAIQTIQYRNQQKSTSTWRSSSSWVPRYRNQAYNFVNVATRDNGVLQYDVTDLANDGYQSQMYNKLVAYIPETIGDQNIALKYSRGEMTAVFISNDGYSNYSTGLSLFKSKTKMDDLTNISFSDDTWFLTYKSKTDAKSTIYSFNFNAKLSQSLVSQTNLVLDGNLDVLNILPLNTKFIYVLAKDSSTQKVTALLYKLTPIRGNYQQDKAFNSLINDNQVAKVDGVPAYDTNGIQSDDQKAVWGTVKFKDANYVQKAGFLSNPASVLADDPNAADTLVEYTPGWDGQNIKITTTANENNQLEVHVSIQYFNGLYYSPQQLSAKNALTEVYGGFSALPQWVLPVAIAVPILFLAIIIALGLGIGIPMAKTRKLQDKGFSSTFKKVDTLTSAVGSVYKKIITQTSVVKKKPQMLKSASSTIKKANSDASTAPKPASSAPSATKNIVSPTKPIGSIKKPVGPHKPIAPDSVKPS